MTLYDISTEHDYDGIECSIFRPKDNIPEVNAADVVLLYQVKVSHLDRGLTDRF
jgi:protection-of-telomeres protein 1